MEEKACNEIAELTGETLNNVLSVLHRAKLVLQKDKALERAVF
jgi:DNA-directed RNA polymerase specialized sigma24 family protein